MLLLSETQFTVIRKSNYATIKSEQGFNSQDRKTYYTQAFDSIVEFNRVMGELNNCFF